MSSTRPAGNRVTDNVIVLDSDDETDLVTTSVQQITETLPKAGFKRSRTNVSQPSRRRSMSRQAADDEEIVDLTLGCSSHTQQPPIQTNNRAADIVVAHTASSPAKRKIAVAKALQAHRKQGQQNAAMHDIQQTQEATDNKPKCGVCLDDMKEPACGTCGHVFCRACLLSCIKATKKCPTCRKTLQPRTVHRIYLS